MSDVKDPEATQAPETTQAQTQQTAVQPQENGEQSTPAVATPTRVRGRGKHPNSIAAAKRNAIRPGQRLNKKGRPNIGLSIREWMNHMQGWTEKQIRDQARSLKSPVFKRAAAKTLLEMIENPDIADYQEFLDGKKSLAELRESGIRTDLVRKSKISDKGHREIELRERSGEAIDRVLDQTAGKPMQPVDHTSDGQPIKAFIGVDIDQV